MGSLQAESIRELSKQIAESFAAEQKIISENVRRLKAAIKNPANDSYYNEERAADFFHSNSKASKDRRDQVFRCQLISIENESKHLALLFSQYRAHQQEAIIRQSQTINKSAKEKEDLLLLLRIQADHENKKQQLLAAIQKRLNDIKKIMDGLEKLIQKIISEMLRENKYFIANFKKGVRANFQKLGYLKGDRLEFEVSGQKLNVDADKVGNIFAKHIQKGFDDIRDNKPVDPNKVKKEMAADLKNCVLREAPKENGATAITEQEAKEVADKIMEIAAPQLNNLDKHFAVTQTKQQVVNLATQRENAAHMNVEAFNIVKKEIENNTNLSAELTEEKIEDLDAMESTFNNSNNDTNQLNRLASPLSDLSHTIHQQQLEATATPEPEQPAQQNSNPPQLKLS